jgi:hypothetical protein
MQQQVHYGGLHRELQNMAGLPIHSATLTRWSCVVVVVACSKVVMSVRLASTPGPGCDYTSSMGMCGLAVARYFLQRIQNLRVAWAYMHALRVTRHHQRVPFLRFLQPRRAAGIAFSIGKVVAAYRSFFLLTAAAVSQPHFDHACMVLPAACIRLSVW